MSRRIRWKVPGTAIVATRVLAALCCMHLSLAVAQTQPPVEPELRLHERIADAAQWPHQSLSFGRELNILYPDLARVVGLDARAEERVLALLAEAFVSATGAWEKRVEGGSQQDFSRIRTSRPNQATALLYTQQMDALAAIMTPAQLERYLDYQHSMVLRQQLEGLFDPPSWQALQPAQRDALVAVLEAERLRRRQAAVRAAAFDFAWFGRLGPKEPPPFELERYAALASLRATEDAASSYDSLLDRLARIAVTDWSEEDSGRLERAKLKLMAQNLRASLKLQDRTERRAEEVLGPARALTANVRLDLEVAVNGARRTATVRSVRGSAVSFDIAEGLIAEALPFLAPGDELMVELRLYERVSGQQRRLLGETWGVPRLTDSPKQQRLPATPSTFAEFRSRRAYRVEWSAKAAYE